MIIFDTETTGLILPSLVRIEEQPQIIEFAGVKLDDITLEEIERLTFMCNPGCALPEEIIKITSITDEMLKDQEPFASHYHDLCDFFLGEQMMVAHNLDFDKTLLKLELIRIGKEFAFPWPPKQVCTVEASFGINNKRMRLSDLHLHCTGEDFKDAHRAMADTEALVRCVRWLRAESMM
jgi:DNA polymerase III epsilon subunit-like protein